MAISGDYAVEFNQRHQTELSSAEFRQMRQRLAGYESQQAWTRQVLTMIAYNEGVRSLDLANRVAIRKRTLKRRLRQLQDLGLTESLGSGYRISPRGAAYLAMLEKEV